MDKSNSIDKTELISVVNKLNEMQQANAAKIDKEKFDLGACILMCVYYEYSCCICTGCTSHCCALCYFQHAAARIQEIEQEEGKRA